METKIGTSFQIRSSFSGGGGVSARRNAYADSAQTQSKNADTFTRYYSDLSGEVENNSTCFYLEHREELEKFTRNLKNVKIIKATDPGNCEGQIKFNFALISSFEKRINENISKKLEEAGVPKDVTFEFDYNFDSRETVLTNISNEEYREKIESALKDTDNMFILAYGSRVMNGYISSIFYPRIENSLKNCFEQDIADLYIDENGNLGGVNKKLQAALNAIKKAEKNGRYINADHEFGFPANDIEGILKRLISDENITPNISRMGYDGERIYTNDGEFKFGKDFDPNLFGEEKYAMRGRMACYMTSHGCENGWLKNYEKFY